MITSALPALTPLSINWTAIGATAFRVAVIVVVALIAIRLLQRLIGGFRSRISEHLSNRESIKRAETLGRVARHLVVVVVSVIAGMLVLSELGIALAPILGAAGVVGLAVGFGAQSLVKDYFTGFFLLFEDQIRQGDVIEVAGHSGLVEEITLRHVQLRDYDGNVHYVPNSTITTVVNMSRGYAQSVIDIGVAYREDIDRALRTMQHVAQELRQDPAFSARILADVEMVGVEKLDTSAVVLRCRFKVAPLEQWTVRREYFRRIKAAFDAEQIEIPYPHITVYAGAARDGSAPPFQLQGRWQIQREPRPKESRPPLPAANASRTPTPARATTQAN